MRRILAVITRAHFSSRNNYHRTACFYHHQFHNRNKQNLLRINNQIKSETLIPKLSSPMASPSSPPPPPSSSSPDQDDNLQLALTSQPKKAAPVPWTHQESVNLIQAYMEKWYSLKRGQLKASQWEEVAVTVAARCGYDEPSKTSTQCRHKIEKLRKRYRAEKLKPNPNSWPLFQVMDQLERGPLPISVRNPSFGEDNEEDSDSDVNYDHKQTQNKSKSINHIVRGAHLGGSGTGDVRVMRNLVPNRNREEAFDDEDEDDEDDDEDESGEMAEGLASEIRGFAERFRNMEKKKIETMRDTERFRMEMEDKRMEMIIESQQKLVDTIHNAFISHKKMKMSE